MRAYMYCRVASPDGGDEALDMQRKVLMVYAQEQNWKIAGCALEKASGIQTDNRPALDMLRTAAKAGEFDVLLAKDCVRIGRGHALYELLDEFSDMGIQVHTVLEGELTARQPKRGPIEWIGGFQMG